MNITSLKIVPVIFLCFISQITYSQTLADRGDIKIEKSSRITEKTLPSAWSSLDLDRYGKLSTSLENLPSRISTISLNRDTLWLIDAEPGYIIAYIWETSSIEEKKPVIIFTKELPELETSKRKQRKQRKQKRKRKSCCTEKNTKKL
jgi:hypothetical protein